MVNCSVGPGSRLQTAAGTATVTALSVTTAAVRSRALLSAWGGGAASQLFQPSLPTPKVGRRPYKFFEEVFVHKTRFFGQPSPLPPGCKSKALVQSLVTTTGELLVSGARVSSYAHSARLHRLTRTVAWLDPAPPTANWYVPQCRTPTQ
jgi:hypothetical protein